MPKTLIVPLDGSETADRALPVAQRIAERFGGCDLVLLRVDVDDGERNRRSLDELRCDTKVLGGSVRTVCATGDPAGAITRLGEIEPDAAICMSTHGRGQVAASLLGSVATDVLRNVTIPVLLVGPRCDDNWWHEPPRLVACWTDGDSDAVLRLANAWSSALGMELSLLSVFRPFDIEACTDPRGQFEPALSQLDVGAVSSTIALLDDFPAAAIADRAATLPATVLAITTRARTGVRRAVLGSVAMDVVHRSPCPVLVGRQ